MINDSELGCNPSAHQCPIDSIKFKCSCEYQKRNYKFLKCNFDKYCVFQEEVTERDLSEYPDLFEEGEE